MSNGDLTVNGETEVKKVKSEDGQISMILQLSTLANFILPFAGLIAAIVIWNTKKEESELVDKQGKEVINLMITQFIGYAISAILMLVLIGIVGIIAIGIHHVVVVAVGAVKASEGKFYRYPAIIRFIN